MTCIHCAPADFPAEAFLDQPVIDWADDGALVRYHLATRFGDRGVNIYLDGEDVTDDVIECMLGRDGWVVALRRGEHCDCGAGLALTVRHGTVIGEVQKVEQYA